MTGKTLHFLIGLWLAAALPSAATAQDDADSLIAASQQVETGLALARRQIAETDLPGAVGTLERLLFAHPQAIAPRLLYASLLCRLDDPRGAQVEISLLAGKPIVDADWAEVASACGTVEPPAPPASKK